MSYCKETPHICLPKAVILRFTRSGDTRLLWHYIRLAYASRDKGIIAKTDIIGILRETGFSVSQAYRWLDRLKTAGMVFDCPRNKLNYRIIGKRKLLPPTPEGEQPVLAAVRLLDNEIQDYKLFCQAVLEYIAVKKQREIYKARTSSQLLVRTEVQVPGLIDYSARYDLLKRKEQGAAVSLLVKELGWSVGRICTLKKGLEIQVNEKVILTTSFSRFSTNFRKENWADKPWIRIKKTSDPINDICISVRYADTFKGFPNCLSKLSRKRVLPLVTQSPINSNKLNTINTLTPNANLSAGKKLGVHFNTTLYAKSKCR